MLDRIGILQYEPADEEMEMNLISDTLASILNNIEQYKDIPADLIERGYVIEVENGV